MLFRSKASGVEVDTDVEVTADVETMTDVEGAPIVEVRYTVEVTPAVRVTRTYVVEVRVTNFVEMSFVREAMSLI